MIHAIWETVIEPLNWSLVEIAPQAKRHKIILCIESWVMLEKHSNKKCSAWKSPIRKWKWCRWKCPTGGRHGGAHCVCEYGTSCTETAQFLSMREFLRTLFDRNATILNVESKYNYNYILTSLIAQLLESRLAMETIMGCQKKQKTVSLIPFNSTDYTTYCNSYSLEKYFAPFPVPLCTHWTHILFKTCHKTPPTKAGSL